MQSPCLFAMLLLCLTARPSNCQERSLFEEVSAALGHQHHQELFDDFERQVLLPRKLSQLGPGITWGDINGDGRDELIIGSGQGGALAIFEYAGANQFKRLNLGELSKPVSREATTILAFAGATAGPALLVALANYEDGMASGPGVRQYAPGNATVQDIVPGQISSFGPLALGDLEGDGNLDLFVGGRVVPGRYPEPASSLIFANRDGHFGLDQANSARLKNVGLVSAAVWTDLDGDGYPELVLACEWGPIRIFHNDRGNLKPWDPPLVWPAGSNRLAGAQLSTLSQLTGFWNGVAAGDFDGDGRMDLAVSNWGLNSKYQACDGHGPRLYYGAWGANGEVEPLQARFDQEQNKWVPERDLNVLSKAMPWVRGTFNTHHAYAQAGVESILGEHLREAQVLEATWLETTVFLNRGDHFEIASLPVNAQFSPAFGVNVADFDGDGAEDIFLSQNFFALPLQEARNDAGRGLLLKGDGKGGFRAIDGSHSGIKIYGEQRGSAVCDYDGDGRVDLAVGQNGAETKLFHNVGAKPGLRVRLKGPPGNPTGVGAVIRVGFGEKWGPARESHAGSGYWSQDSTIQVMGLPETPTKIQVLWPGGKRSETVLEKNAREVEIRQP